MTQDLPQRIGRVIQEYDLQGWHRTGTAVDADSARWLADWVRSYGLDPVLEPFDLDRVDPVLTYLEIDGQRIDGLPFFESSFTDAAGVRGRLGLLGGDAEIGLAEMAVISDPTDAFTQARHSGNYQALVAITMGGQPGLAPRNAEDFIDPFGPPVLQVDLSIGDWLKESASQGAEARLVAQVERTPAQAFNVVTKVPGLDQSLRPLVVMTPRSGWWNCAAERGGGIACWLEIAQAVHSDGPMRDVYFVASSGHELGHLGLKAFLDQHPGLARDALTWIHLGASIGSALEPQPRVWNSDDEMESLVLDAMPRPSLRKLVLSHRPVLAARSLEERPGISTCVTAATSPWPASTPSFIWKRTAGPRRLMSHPSPDTLGRSATWQSGWAANRRQFRPHSICSSKAISSKRPT